jgi:hypothetical protein
VPSLLSTSRISALPFFKFDDEFDTYIKSGNAHILQMYCPDQIETGRAYLADQFFKPPIVCILSGLPVHDNHRLKCRLAGVINLKAAQSLLS